MKVWLDGTDAMLSEEAKLLDANRNERLLRKDGWQFNWRNLFKVESALFYKLITYDPGEIVQGMLMLSLINDEMLYLNNVEVAPHNYGGNGLYKNIAGCLLAYACYKSFELGRGHYTGFVSFDSKTELIELYQEKYGATYAIGQKMFFTPEAGRILIKDYLQLQM